MKKNLFLTLITVMVCAFTMSAGNVRIMVDNPANVKVQTNSGYGKTLDLGDGNASFTDLTSDDSPLLISANPGATIEKVEVNEEAMMPGGDGQYRIGINADGMMINITTSGNATGGGETARMVSISGIIAMGDGISGSPYTVSYDKDGEWELAGKDDFGFLAVPENSTVKISPVGPYRMEKLTFRNGNPIETTALADGSLTFKCTYDEFYYQSIYAYMILDPEAIKFSITVDYAPNLSAALENQREGTYQFLTLKDGKNNFVCLPDNSPLEFFETAGAEILGMTRNGEVCNPIGWEGTNGWVYELEDGDAFVVKTKGKPVQVALSAPEGNAPLQSYFFIDSMGNSYTPTGMDDTISTFNGDSIFVTPRPGTSLTFIEARNGGQTNYTSYFRAAVGADGVNPMKVSLYGTRATTGVTINVDAADRIQIMQEGGRGEQLVVADGKNQFALDDIKNALAIKGAEGNQIVSVTQNGDILAPNADGVYLVTVADGDWVEIVSRKNPVDVELSFNIQGGTIEDLTATVDGQNVTLTSPMTVKTYAETVIAPADGYNITSLTTEAQGTTVQNIPDTQKYLVVVNDATVTKAEIAVTLQEIPAEEGYAIVIPKGDDIFVRYMEFSKDENGEYKYVQTLTNNTVNQVKLGNYVQVYCKDTLSKFRFVRANGTDVTLEPNKDDRYAYVLIEGRTVIEAEIYTPALAYTNESFDEVKLVKSGCVYFEVNGENVKSLDVEAGQTVKLVAVPELGYIFDHFERFYPTDVEGFVLPSDGKTTTEYTFTEADVANNFILFKGVFKENPDEKSYVVRGSKAWLADENGEIKLGVAGVMGSVVFENNVGELVTEITGVEGTEVKLFVSVNDQETAGKYEVWFYCLDTNFPNNKIEGATYTIKAEDADYQNVIWIDAVVREKGTGVEGIDAENSFRYNAGADILYAPAEVKVYDAAGRLVLTSAETEVSLETLPAGLYFAVSNGKQLKFMK